MTRCFTAIVGATIAVLAACERPGNDGLLADFEELPSARPSANRSAALTLAKSAASAPSSTSAHASASVGAASGASSSAPAAATAKPASKVYDCGDKGKPDCPMQRWMKSVAGGAAMSGDASRLKAAFLAMSKAPPGMPQWAALCAQGAAKAAEGDIDGAKAVCKACHAKYQAIYRANYRDMPWP